MRSILQNSILLLIISLINVGVLAANSSDSDSYEYRNICERAAIDDVVFETFKRNPDYNGILEHVSQSIGYEYLEFISVHYPHLLSHFAKFQENDVLGSPLMYHYPKIGETGPTTLRYVKVLGDLEYHFGKLDQQKIIEIGAGYGGQSLVVSKLFQFSEYIIVDLPEPLMLAQKYLNLHKVENVCYLHPDDIPVQAHYDLVVSNYAFSECVRSVQTMYMERIIKNSTHGYLTLNGVDVAASLGRYTLLELVENLRIYGFDPRILSEEPRTGPSNRILIW